MNISVQNDSNLVVTLVHLGLQPDAHYWLNLNKISLDFPTIQVAALVSKGVERDPNLSSAISVYEYTAEPDVEKIFELHGYDHKFREGFWRFTLERLFALAQLHEMIPGKMILHIESDVMLLPNFPFDKIKKLNNTTWCRFNDFKDVSSILVLPDLESSRSLRKNLLGELLENNKHTDMTILNTIARKNSDIQIFPSLSGRFPNLQNDLNSRCDTTEFNICSKEELNGIVDPAAIGMWLTGLDPRNFYGITKIHDRGIIDTGDSYVDPSRYAYRLDSENQLFISSENHSLQIFCLHIHSKNLKLFKDGWEKELRDLVQLSAEKGPCNEFDFTTLVKLILVNIRQGTFLAFIIGIPVMQRFRRSIRALKTAIQCRQKYQRS
jgi:hypothetical protein